MSAERSSHSQLPPSVLFRWATVAAVFVVVLLCMIQSLATGNRVILLGMIAAPISFVLISKPNWWFVLIVGLFHSWVYVPGFPTALSVFNMMTMTFVPVLLIGRAIRPVSAPEPRPMKVVALCFLGVVVATILVRGMGMQFFGGGAWGGGAYVHLLCAIPLFVLCDSITLTRRQTTAAVCLFLGAVLVPATAEMIFLLSKGAIVGQYMVVRAEGSAAVRNLAALTRGEGVLRFQVSKNIALVFTMSLALWSFRGRHALYICMAFAVAVVFVGISGHRSAVIYLLLLMPIFAYLKSGRLPVGWLTLYFFGLAAIMLGVHQFGRLLPLSVQRGLSWVPFSDITWDAELSATRTIQWRFMVWARAMEMLPDCWLVGRGFTFNQSHLLWLPLSATLHRNVEWALITHNYHSGPISLLIDLGLPGLLLGSALIVGGFIKHYRRLSQPWADTGLARLHSVLLASYAVDVLRFYFVMGDASLYIVAFLVQQMILDAICRTNRALLQTEALGDVQ